MSVDLWALRNEAFKLLFCAELALEYRFVVIIWAPCCTEAYKIQHLGHPVFQNELAEYNLKDNPAPLLLSPGPETFLLNSKTSEINAIPLSLVFQAEYTTTRSTRGCATSTSGGSASRLRRRKASTIATSWAATAG